MVSVLSACTESCGWIAAICCLFAWGSFGVPIKSIEHGDVNFFVMQSYKTIVCFLTSWFVVLLGEPVRFTYWGVVSGLFWVPGAACGIYAIRTAGISAAVGLWSSIQVVASFIFGIIIFQEKVKDEMKALMAFVVLVIGLVGMSRYSDPEIDKETSTSNYHHTSTSTTNDRMTVTTIQSPEKKNIPPPNAANVPSKRKTSTTDVSAGGDDNNMTGKDTMTPLEIDDEDRRPLLESDDKNVLKDRVVLFGGRLVLTKHQLGMLGAVVNGAWGGMNLIPLHYAKRDLGMSGAGYLISYATGSMIVCIAIWIGIFIFYFIKKGNSVKDAVEALPKWNLREIGLPGLFAGLLYSIGNFCAIIAVSYLGQGVGFSFCQGQLIISGSWGIFYFHEITHHATILKWFASAMITISGIIWLSYQH
eukprot:CAMPEP_0113494500 /NCGR_PEP_ID=MMETSP0014_2-20120614/29137_1 /TAXON_ID=2857 /ORGANISM="Nitzschia sp." /LENGTH=416 /DNA_ID=CAMNT_0000388391 /DNA_START=381 /DNA_END=1628 /DNA_ORIENTATION=- /assembly_acc=CAM_ASM_000159